MNKQLIIAHRGESYLAPENTLTAINLAWELGADAIEVDIRLTKDKQIAVFHDANTKRITGRYKRIKNTNLEELQKLDAGKYKSEKYIGEKIPTLGEVLKTVPDGKKILIEIKSGREIIPFLNGVIKESKLQENQIEIICFNLNVLKNVRKQTPQLPTFWILALDYYWIQKMVHPSISRIIQKASKHKLSGLDLWAGKRIDNKLLSKIKKANLRIYTWTVDNPEQAQNLLNMGVHGITTNRAGWMKDQLNKFQKTN
ncbi:MAG TPA: glycerophosphodiester phosphodiesterase [Bacteroidales bacterium]|jgi:glycerophosphoryl diester phosphodiesterase|nr:glycerophosphodiester phosphodiesterase [Bacteroidales bacterium]